MMLAQRILSSQWWRRVPGASRRLSAAQRRGDLSKRAASIADSDARCMRPRAAGVHFGSRLLSCGENEAHELRVGGESRQRLDSFLAEALGGLTRCRVQSHIKEGVVTVNGQVCSKASRKVQPGDVVGISIIPPPPLNAEPEPIPLEIVHEDDAVIVVNKVSAMPVSCSGVSGAHCLVPCSQPAW